MTLNKIDYIYNPNTTIRETSLVLSGIDTLEFAIHQKRRGKIKFLLVGPNISVLPSRWVKEAYEKDCPELIGRIKIWAAGIDETYWSDVKKLLDTCIYRTLFSAMESIQNNNIKKSYLYLDLLFFLSQSESQGIALAEAWAMDVPTFSWNPREFVYKMHTFKNVSSAPYTTSENGTLWKDIDELYCALNLFLKENTYSPRK